MTGAERQYDFPCYIHLNVVLAGEGQGACRDVASQRPRHSGIHWRRWAASTALTDWRKDDGDELKRSKQAIERIGKRHLKTQAHSTNQTREQRCREKVIVHDECYLEPESSAIDLKRAHQQEHDV